MATLWPWLAIAGVGALHGLSPATGWMFAAAWGVRAGGEAQVMDRALVRDLYRQATRLPGIMGWPGA